MYFEVTMPENGGKNIFRGNQAINQVPLTFLAVKVPTERQQLRFRTLPTKKQGAVFVFTI